MGGITVWIKNRFLAGRCLKGIQITARDIPLKPIKQADISSDIQHFVETDVTLGTTNIPKEKAAIVDVEKAADGIEK